MCRFIDSFIDKGMHNLGWKVAILAQDYTQEDLKDLKDKDKTRSCTITHSSSLIPPYIAKTTLLEQNEADVYCSLDDDCVIINQTNYEPVIQFVQQKFVGLVSCNWVRFNTPKMMACKKIREEYKKQKIVFTGGGIIFNRSVRDVLIKKPRINWLFDDVQFSVDVYTAGFLNYRYLGSLTEHNIIIGGGIKRLFNERQMTLNDQNLINLKRGSGTKYAFDNGYYMPNDSNITELSHSLHKQNHLQLIRNA